MAVACSGSVVADPQRLPDLRLRQADPFLDETSIKQSPEP